MGQIVGFQTPHDAWMALHKIFSASSKARILQLRLEFQTAKKGADPMLEYILKIKTISDNLAAIGELVKETDHILQLLGGLGSEYNSIVASLTAREDDLSLHSIHSILLTHEQRLNHQHTSSADLPFVAAHIVVAPSTQHPRPHHPRFQSPQPRFQSHYLGNHQHVPFSHTRPHNRPHNRPANRFSSSAPHRPPHLPTRPQCQLCGKFGHTVVKCYHRFDITYQGTSGVSSSQDSSPLQAMLAAAPNHQDSWFFDTGATHHLSHSAQTLSHVQPYSGADQVTIGDGHSLPILNTGNKSFFFHSKVFCLNQVLHVPQLSTNLISVSKFCTDNAVFFEFHSTHFFVKDQVTKQTLLKGWLRDGLYEFPSSSSTHAFVSTSSVPALTPGAIWHSRLGHPATPILSKALASCNPSVSFQINKIAPCKICPLAKSHSLPYSLSSSHASQPLALIHTDLWGPAPSPSTSGARYFLLFIDDYSRYTWIYFLSTKDQALSTFITFRKMIENQLNSTIKCIQSDNGGEFIAFKPYLEAHGIVHQFSCPHTPQQNGRAERKICHLVETGMALLAQSFLPSKYWSFAFQTSVYLINLLPAKLLNFQSPLQVLFHKIPNYHHLRVFGCLCFPSLRPYNHHKLSYRSTACVFLGYASAHKGYICLDVSTSRLYISRDVLFHESSFPFQSIPAPSPLPQHTPLTSALINPPLLSTSSPSTVSFPVLTSSTDCTSTSDSLPPLLQVPFAPTPSPTPSSSSSPLNTHPMVTRAKSGIHKKKSFLMQTTSEPHTYNQASKSEP